MTTRTQSWQLRTDKDLKNLGKLKDSSFVPLLDSLDADLDYPLKLAATFPTPDAKLNFSASSLSQADAAKKVLPPVKKQVFSLTGSPFIDFQTQAVSNAADFDIEWPASTVGQFRRAGFTLIGSGKIKVLFSAEAASEGALANPGTLMVNGGLPLGYVDLVCTNALGYFKTAGSATDIIENAKIFRFGSGAGGGSGTGDASSFDNFLTTRLYDSYFSYACSVNFEVDEAAFTQSATATYDLVDGVYLFSAGGQNFLSKQLFGSEFLLNDREGRKVEFHLDYFDTASIDENAVVEASLDGTNFEPVTMERQGLTKKMIGSLRLAEPSSVVLFTDAQTGTVSPLTDVVYGRGDKFEILAKSVVKQLTVDLTKTGSPAGRVFVKIYSGTTAPTTEIFSKPYNVSELSSGANILTLNMKAVLPPGNYWLAVETDEAYRASYTVGNKLDLLTHLGSGTGNQNLLAGGWAEVGNGFKNSISGYVYDLRMKVTSSAGGKKLKAFAALYDENYQGQSQGDLAQQRFIFEGTSNQTTFAVTKFLPDPNHLRVFDVKTGQAYVYPAFNIDGHNVTFPANTFSSTDDMELLFDQSQGSGYDHSDVNANLMAANHLGSTDTTISKAANGRGILLKTTDGVLKELWLGEGGAIYVTDPK